MESHDLDEKIKDLDGYLAQLYESLENMFEEARTTQTLINKLWDDKMRLHLERHRLDTDSTRL